MISPDGQVTTIAGSTYGFANGQGPNARFAFPTGIAVGPDDQNLYVADTYNHRIRKLTRPAVEGGAWEVTTLAGSTPGFLDGSGTAARFSSPQGLVVNSDGVVFVADSGTHRVRRITAQGTVTTLAGSGLPQYQDGIGLSASFHSPAGVTLDSLGNLFVADRGNHRIRRVTSSGVVTTLTGTGIAGSADGALSTATFSSPSSIAIDPYNTLYVSEEGSHLIRRITPASRHPQPEVQTVAGKGTEGFLDAIADTARFDHPAGLVVMPSGHLVVADSENHCIRLVRGPILAVAESNPALPDVKATIDAVAMSIPPGNYFFRWRARNWTVEEDGLKRLITTVAPIARTQAATEVYAGEVRLNGVVNPQHLPVTGLKFELSASEGFEDAIELSVAPVAPAEGWGSVEVPFSLVYAYPTNAAVGTVFYYRAKAINDYGNSVSTQVESFAVPAATVVTEPVTAALTTRYQARLNATVNPTGSSLGVTFAYSPEPGLGDFWVVSTAIERAAGGGGAQGAAVTSTGDVFFSRSHLNKLVRHPSGLEIGSGVAGFGDGDFSTARFDRPAGVAVYEPAAGVRWLYVCDEFNHCVRKVDLNTGRVTTLAGATVAGFADGSPSAARFLYPTGIAVDGLGNVYVADSGNHCIRRIAVEAGMATAVTTIAGANEAGVELGAALRARFEDPRGLAFDASGSLLIADTGNHRICRLQGGEVSLVAGGDGEGFSDGRGSAARFSSPCGLSVDSAGRILVADRGNHRIRRISPDGSVDTLAGDGEEGLLDSPNGDSGLASAKATKFKQPNGIVAAGNDEFYVTGAGDEAALRKIAPGSIRYVHVAAPVTGTASQFVGQETLVLSPATTYYYQAIGDNRMDGDIRGEILSFTTRAEPVIAVDRGTTVGAGPLQPDQEQAVDFGVMARAAVAVESFTLSNSGGWPLTVSQVLVPPGYTVTNSAGVVPVNGSMTFQVSFTGAAAGFYNGSVVIFSDDPEMPEFRFPITGKKVDPPIIHNISLRNLSVAPTSVTLVGEVDPNGADARMEFQVSPGPDFEAVRVTTPVGGAVGFADGTGAAAQFGAPRGMVVDQEGMIYVADTANHRIRRITPAGVVTTIAGTGVAGFADGLVNQAQFDRPIGIALGADGVLYVTDNHRVRRIANGSVTTLAGTGEASFTDGVGNAARFHNPMGMVLDASGLLYVADRENSRIRRVAANGEVVTLAQLGASARPTDLAIDAEGMIYVVDPANHVVLKVTPTGAVSTFAGSGAAGFEDGTSARFNQPTGIAYDGEAKVFYIADSGNARIRKLSLEGEVTTLAGSGVAGMMDGDGPQAQFDQPVSVAVLREKTVLVGQLGGAAIRQITPKVIRVFFNNTISSSGEFTKPLSGLNPRLIYYYRLVFTSVGGRVVSEPRLLGPGFTPVPPIARTQAATEVYAGEVRLNGVVNPQHLPVTGLKFELSASEGFEDAIELSVAPVAPAEGWGSVEVPFSLVYAYPTNAAVGTVFYYRAKAINDYGNSVSTQVESFAVPAATVVTEPVTAALTTRYQARLNATVNPTGSSLGVTFAYSPEPGLGDFWVVSTAIERAAGGGGAQGAAVTSTGDVFFSRSHLNKLVRHPSGLEIGSGVAGFGDGDFSTARFDRPAGVAVYEPAAGVRWLYVCDEFNHCVRKVDLNTGRVTTLAGATVAGFADGSPSAARFLYPTGIAVDGLGNVYVADSGNHCIRRIAVEAGMATAVTTIAGANEAGVELGAALRARFEDPRGLAFDASGSLLIADTGNHRICRLQGGEVSLVAGGDGEGFSDGRGSAARFSSPCGLSVDSAGRILVADRGNHRIRRISPDGSVDTLAGDGEEGLLDSPNGDSGLASAKATKFKQPNGIVAAGNDEFYVTGAGDEAALRKIAPGSIRYVHVAAPVTGTASQFVGQETLVLSPATTYYYQAIGDNRMDGDIRGEILSFTTRAEPVIAVDRGTTVGAGPLQPDQEQAVDFGVMARAAVAVESFTLSNSGGWPLTVSQVLVPPGYTVTNSAGVVPVNGSMTFQVSFTGAAAGFYNGSVVIFSDDPEMPEFRFPITGKKVDPPIIHNISLRNLSVAPTSVTLVGEVDPNGADARMEFQVSPGPDFEAVRVTTPVGGAVGFADGTGAAAQFGAPRGMVVDQEGMIYVADTANHRIRRITPAGVVTTIAGTGVAGFADGLVNQAQFDRPIGIALGADGVLYVTDNHRVRRIANGSVTTLAGTGEASFTDGVGNAARFHNPMGMVLDASGLLYVADRENSRIRRVAANGEVVTLAQLGASARPTDLAIDAEGMIYVVDPANHVVLKVTPTGAVSTFAGSGAAGFEDGTSARFNQPTGIAYDGEAKVFYIADSGNARIRKLSLEGEVTTLAGSGVAGMMDGDGPQAQFDQPVSVAVLREKTVLVGQLGGAAIRQITPKVIRVFFNNTISSSGEFTKPLSGLNPRLIYYYRLVFTSVGGRVVSEPRLLGTQFTQWQLDQFGEDAVNPLIAGPDANPSGDGVSNLMKYALGLTPHARAHTGLPLLRTDHPSVGFFSLSYNPSPSATNVRFFFESSTDFQQWETNEVQINNHFGYLPYKDLPRRYIRLGVELVLP